MGINRTIVVTTIRPRVTCIRICAVRNAYSQARSPGLVTRLYTIVPVLFCVIEINNAAASKTNKALHLQNKCDRLFRLINYKAEMQRSIICIVLFSL